MIPHNFAVYMGNVPLTQGIPRGTTARRSQHRKRFKKPQRYEPRITGEKQQDLSSQTMEPRALALDNNITELLPNNARVIKATELTGHASRIIRFDTRAPSANPRSDGVYRSYFLKLIPHKNGHDILRGEYNSLKAIHNVTAYFVPNPIAWGTLAQDAAMYFLLCDYHEMERQVVNTDRFAAALAHLHSKSATPDGQFRFHVPTFIGIQPQENRATATWEEYFSNNLRNFIDYEKIIQGPHDPGLTDLTSAILLKVVPRLLRPLETDGRSVTPCLLHGDISTRKASTSLQSHLPIIYGASAFYGHNEYDIRDFIPGRFGKKCLEAYQKLVPISQPKEDFSDRLALYGLRSLLHDSYLHPEEKRFREELKEGMKRLVDKYPGGYQDWVGQEAGIQDLVAQDALYDQMPKAEP